MKKYRISRYAILCDLTNKFYNIAIISFVGRGTKEILHFDCLKHVVDGPDN